MAKAPHNWFDSGTSSASPVDEVLYVDVAGYGGPLDLLLDLARRQKVDLTRISVLALAEQYLAFIETVREKRIEIAADYLVMAAWLAYLKSRLMVPQAPGDEEPSGEMMAALLQFRLKRLEAMRQAASQLMNRPRLGFQVYARGLPEPITVNRRNLWEASLYDLLKAYAIQRERGVPTDYELARRTVWSLKEARDILQRLLGESSEWVALDAYLAQYLGSPEQRVTAMASSFASSLELVRQGELELRQTLAFGPLLLRRKQAGPTEGSDDRH
ncbi:segregation/condensation protein A [Arsenicitalea aurantiaca]|uniref:Segregation and condensation protein A n=1 Tax=Arsenicitalea aurantiaca TaxID=1783274 RepID=A0A433XF04_9HYPH|nr:ScpA family protein [Arsenicitalea aurantiaca]RUT32681.1 segregation/condensation protein A [Arsenicitalea aurantiaca]